MGKKYLKLLVVVFIGIAVIYFLYGSYRGMNALPMYTEHTSKLKSEIKDAGLGKIHINYRAMQTLEVKCTKKGWNNEEQEQVLTMLEGLLKSDDFEETYALKYARRYKTKAEDSYLKDVVVYFWEKDELVATAMYSTVRPFSEWYEFYNKENEL